MHRQVGDLILDDEGLAVRGLLVRHLIMLGEVADTRQVMRFLAQGVSPHTYVNLIDQYWPYGRADSYPQIARPISAEELEEALEATRQEGIHRLDRDVGRRFQQRQRIG